MRTLVPGVSNLVLMVASRRRGICIWLGFAVVLLLALFPPWIENIASSGEYGPARTLKLWHAATFAIR